MLVTVGANPWGQVLITLKGFNVGDRGCKPMGVNYFFGSPAQ